MTLRVGSILVVEDEAPARTSLAQFLRDEGYDVEEAATGAEAIERGRQRRFDVVLTDIRMQPVDGFAVLQEFRQQSPDTAVVMLTGFGSMEGAIDAIGHGAYDYLAKPFDRPTVRMIVKRSLEHSRLVRENARFREELRERHEPSWLIGNSAPMLDVYTLIARVAPGRSNVLIEGESGTGKELIARAIHANSPRRGRPFVAVNCAALPDTLLESELFGHEKGAFTGAVATKKGLFEAAHEGTIFLDEIGDVGPALQVKLLRVLQEHEVRRLGGTSPTTIDVRVLAATNRTLTQLVSEGKFREDLFYRLNVVRIVVPPLRERREDIPMLVHHFIQKMAATHGPTVRSVVPDTMEVLRAYHWPGNVRELENVIERAVSLARGLLILPEDLPQALRQTTPELPRTVLPWNEETLISLEELEKRYLLHVLKETAYNKARAAKVLGIDRRTLYRMADRFHIDLGEESPEVTG